VHATVLYEGGVCVKTLSLNFVGGFPGQASVVSALISLSRPLLG
jgi:hypothetical protein